MAFDVLIVCTANICRSPAGETALRTQLGQRGFTPAGVSVSSAGTDTLRGRPACEESAALLATLLRAPEADLDHDPAGGDTTRPKNPHTTRRLKANLIADADLILTADRSHRARVVKLVPSARPKAFTIRQAARLADWIVNGGQVLGFAAQVAASGEAAGTLPNHLVSVPPLPNDPIGRLQWLVAEMDAARGLAPVADELPGWDSEDVPDPHEHGTEFHPVAIEAMVRSTESIADALTRVVTMPVPAPEAMA